MSEQSKQGAGSPGDSALTCQIIPLRVCLGMHGMYTSTIQISKLHAHNPHLGTGCQ